MAAKIFLSEPHMGGSELEFIHEAFVTNWIGSLGPHVTAFEQELANYTGAAAVSCVSSGTAAIHLALILAGVERGDEVICSSFTFSASANPIVYQGATPIFVDSESLTWNMDPELLEKAIKDRIARGKKPKAVIIVHLYGMPAQIDKIVDICQYYDIPLIEDAAEALGSKYKGRQVGTFGRMGIISFNGNKIITTSSGGALLANDPELCKKATFLATQARDNFPYYHHTHIGYNYRMSNILAGVGRGQLRVLDQRVEARRRNFFAYKKFFASFPGVTLLEEPDESYFSNHWLTTIVLDPAQTAVKPEDLRLTLEKENIESRPLWKPMHLQPVFQGCPAYVNGVSEALFAQGLCLPSSSTLTDDDFGRVTDCLRQVLERG
ncbi:MAG TPA: aminotransferase class I/II-fold pyridoxal phosphate-dependent enzyme [Bacteroidales bacterium]|nr:aminotransferase class I/II-fold pyridoxal phosphate-dependent enzyme [Bacteroidales bacterium]